MSLPDPYDTIDDWVEERVYASSAHDNHSLDRIANFANKELGLTSVTRKEIGQIMIGICRRKNYDIISYPFDTDN